MSRLILQGPVVPRETAHSGDDPLPKARMKLAPIFHHHPPKDHSDEIGISKIIWQFALSRSTPRQNCRRKFDFLDPTLPLPRKLLFFVVSRETRTATAAAHASECHERKPGIMGATV